MTWASHFEWEPGLFIYIRFDPNPLPYECVVVMFVQLQQTGIVYNTHPDKDTRALTWEVVTTL